jgi:microcompartment protein CcmL/EutN
VTEHEPQDREGEPRTTQGRALGDYFKPVSRHSLFILALVALAFVAGLLISSLNAGAIPYEAEAFVFFKPGAGAQVDLSADPQFRNAAFDATRQQRNVVLLMGSVDVAKEVQKRAAADSNSAFASIALKTPLAIYGDVRVQIKGDFISVKASADTAAKATWLANTWAEVGVSVVNKAYAQPSSNVSQALEEAKSQLDVDQKALEDFLTDNPINDIAQELTATESLIAAAINSSVNTDIVLQDAERDSVRAQISKNYTTTATLSEQLNELAALRTRIERSPEDRGSLYSNQVALLLLLNKVLAGSPVVSEHIQQVAVQLQINVTDLANGPLSKSSQLSDLDSTVAAVQKLRDDVGRQTAELTSGLISPGPPATPGASKTLSPTLQAYIEQQGKLQSQLEQLKFQKSRLEKTRDLQQNAYDLLRSRLAEQNVNVLISSIVEIGSAADEAQTAAARSVLRSVALATGEWVLFALALAIVLAYLFNALWPNFNSNHALRTRISRGGQKRVSVSRGG